MGYLDNTGLATLWARIKQLKLANPNTLKFTGNASASYDGSKAVSVYIPPSIDNNTFVAEYGVTPYQDVYSAYYDQGKPIVVVNNNDKPSDYVYQFVYNDYGNNRFIFECWDSDSQCAHRAICFDDGWEKEDSYTYATRSDIPSRLANPYKLTFTGASTGTYDGSSAVTVNIPSGGGGGTELPTGTVNIFAGSTAPDGWLLCKGQAVSRTTYADLFAVIGTTYGYTSSTTFNLPNLCNNVPVGAGGSYSLGATGGESTHTLSTTEMPSHTHTQNSHTHTQYAHTHTQNSHTHTQASHTHADPNGGRVLAYNYQKTATGISERAVAKATSGNYMALISNNASTDYYGFDTTTSQTPTINAATATNQSATATNYSTTATNQNTGGSGAHNNMQPYLAMNYIIKY